MARRLGAEGHANRRRREAQRFHRPRAARRDNPQAVGRPRPGDRPHRAAGARDTRGIAESGDRQVVAPYQGGKTNDTMSPAEDKRDDALSLIDVHHHFIPPFYLDENRERIAKSRGGSLSEAWLGWSPQRSLDAMDQHGVRRAMLSMSTPGVWFGDAQAALSMARRCNDYAAALVARHPPRFGHFAAV